MRLIDAEALKNEVKGLFCTDGYIVDFIKIIDNAPTVEPFEPDYVGAERLKARQRGYEQGYHEGIKIGKTLNPKIKQGEFEKSEPYRCECDAIVIEQRCSVCKRWSIRWAESIPSKFCSHCGSDMRGERK